MTFPGKWPGLGVVLQIFRRVHAVSGFASRLVTVFRMVRVLQVYARYLHYPTERHWCSHDFFRGVGIHRK